MRPLIGITAALTAGTGRGGRADAPDPGEIRLSRRYADAVARVGGTPIVVTPPLLALESTPGGGVASDDAGDAERTIASDLVARLDGWLFTGGDDPHTEPFGVPTDSRVTPVHPDRQRWELLLLDTLERERPDAPVLGVCLGMQLMCLRAGGTLDQWLPDVLGASAGRHHPYDTDVTAADAVDTGSPPIDVSHPMIVDASAVTIFGKLGDSTPIKVPSRHRQGVRHAGALTVLGRADDGLIEAVASPDRRFAVGVQWHAERVGPGPIGDGLIAMLVEHAAASNAV